MNEQENNLENEDLLELDGEVNPVSSSSTIRIKRRSHRSRNRTAAVFG